MYMHYNELNYLESLMSFNEIKIIVTYVCQALSLFQSILLSLGSLKWAKLLSPHQQSCEGI
jgi:hypothetical protein